MLSTGQYWSPLVHKQRSKEASIYYSSPEAQTCTKCRDNTKIDGHWTHRVSQCLMIIWQNYHASRTVPRDRTLRGCEVGKHLPDFHSKADT